MLKQSSEKTVRNRIDLSTKELARHWCKHLGVSLEELESAVAKVGGNVAGPIILRSSARAAAGRRRTGGPTFGLRSALQF